MILSNLFQKISKNNWQNKDCNVRIAAINDELTCEDAKQSEILLELANNDNSDLVRRAALIKLNSFKYYLEASETNSQKGIQSFAQKQVSEILANNHAIVLSSKQKENLLEETNNISFLESWLYGENNASIICALYEKLAAKKNKTQLLLQVFTKKQNLDVQKQLLAEVNDRTLLEKLAKKSVSEEISLIIVNKLTQINDEEAKPKILKKQLQLLLSKLLALKDIKDYALYLEKKDHLVQEWQTAQPQLICLTADEQQETIEKYKNIHSQLVKIFAPKEEAYQQEKIIQQLALDKQQAKDNFSKTIAVINQVITTAVFENSTLEQQAFIDKLDQLSVEINNSVLNAQEQAEFTKQSALLKQRLTQLPEIAESVTQATHLISKVSQLALPKSLNELNERQNIFNDWLLQWRDVEKKTSGILPQSIKEAYQEIKQLWQTGLKPLQKEQKNLFQQNKKKLNDLKRLLIHGKYKVCFGLFKGVNQAMHLLTENQQQQLQRDFTQVSEKMTEISDWEHYIATPRKQQLLSDVQALVLAPLDNPNEQAEQVKSFRKIWNSLGHADEDVDTALNEQFNLACEQAFAPCRLFYAEQEKLRAQHLINRNNILEQAQALIKSFNETCEGQSIDFKYIDAQLNKLQQQWLNAGEVDRQQYQQLQRQFKNILQPLKNAIKDFHESNVTKKKTLISKASAEVENDNVFNAIENTKKLQQEWRSVGFAGSHQENKLWQTFRTFNDQVFNKREQAKVEQQLAQVELIDQYNEALSGIKLKLSEQPEKHSLTQAKQAAEQLLTEVIAKKPVNKKVANNIENFIKECQKQIAELAEKAQRLSWLSLFNLMEKLAKTETSHTTDYLTSEPDFKQVNNFWQKRLHEQILKKQPADKGQRLIKTLTIEILAQAESPAEFAPQRMAVQVQLMQEKMLSGEAIDLTSQLVNWLQLGKLSNDDVTQLERLQPIFVK
ncbi:MAG: DUF349 domain-containing protein [Colwellia sp.]